MSQPVAGNPEKMRQAARLIEDEGDALRRLAVKGEGLLMDLRSAHQGEAATVHQRNLEATLRGFIDVYNKVQSLSSALGAAGSTARNMEDALKGRASATGGGNSISSAINYS
jgi:uncharacterized protein YukE